MGREVPGIPAPPGGLQQVTRQGQQSQHADRLTDAELARNTYPLRTQDQALSAFSRTRLAARKPQLLRTILKA